jgi:formate hydrogenlyase subunit 6/NADH:ubiquinone oxidoreductase subunit I
VELDDPARAATLMNETCDAQMRKYVPAVLKGLDDTPEVACMELARWYQNLAASAGPAGTAAMLKRAHGYYERYLGLHTSDDLPRSQAALAMRKTEEQLAKLGTTTKVAFRPSELPNLLRRSWEHAVWKDKARTCYSCGSCNIVCPTCYCFLLCDRQEEPGSYARSRVWDSCQFTGYSQMAGPPGTRKPDPRRDHMSKFQRRFAHKLWHDVKVNQMFGCVGCGRCRETCPGAIDLRRVITRVNSVRASHA